MRSLGEDDQRPGIISLGRSILAVMDCLCLRVSYKKQKNRAKSAQDQRNFGATIRFPHPDWIDRLRLHEMLRRPVCMDFPEFLLLPLRIDVCPSYILKRIRRNRLPLIESIGAHGVESSDDT